MSANDPQRTREWDADADEPRIAPPEQPARQGAATPSGAHVMSPGLGSETDPSAAASASVGGSGAQRAPAAAAPSQLERPEVVAGIAFGGGFLLARILKRLVD